MMPNDSNLLARYLQAVRRYMPAPRQDDLLAELSANLQSQMDDRAEALGRPLTEDEQADVLRRHGHPLLVAARYQLQRSLIGPELFPFYAFTIKRILPLVVAVYLLARIAAIIFGTYGASIAERINVGHIITGTFGAAFQFLAVITALFAILEYFKGYFLKELSHPQWDPRKLPQIDPHANEPGPRHPYADVIASAVFLSWLLAFPRFPVLMFGPYVAWHLLNIDLPSVWHQFYWIIIGFNCIQLISKVALLFYPVRRYYHVIDSVIHLLGMGTIVFLLRTRDYIGEATFGGDPLSPATVTRINNNIHIDLILVLVLMIGKFLWDTAKWLRPAAVNSTGGLNTKAQRM